MLNMRQAGTWTNDVPHTFAIRSEPCEFKLIIVLCSHWLMLMLKFSRSRYIATLPTRCAIYRLWICMGQQTRFAKVNTNSCFLRWAVLLNTTPRTFDGTMEIFTWSIVFIMIISIMLDITLHLRTLKQIWLFALRACEKMTFFSNK